MAASQVQGGALPSYLLVYHPSKYTNYDYVISYTNKIYPGKKKHNYNVAPPSDVCWLKKKTVTMVICVP